MLHKIKHRLIYGVGSLLAFLLGKNAESKNYLEEVHNKYSGRCFIIGNGPSLLPEDLDKLKGEVTFASNRIYKIFEKTEWRPTYFAMFDESVSRMDGVIDGVNQIECLKFVRAQGYLYYRKIKGNVCYLHSWWDRKYLDVPAFSEELETGVYTIASVTYVLIQLARWMGFDEIYLLGMDNRYAYSKLKDGSIVRNEGVASYFGENGIKLPDPSTAVSTWELDVAFDFAKKYSRSHGFRIYNATRGGFLESFERIDLDDMLAE